jgi:hypothetical protein
LEEKVIMQQPTNSATAPKPSANKAQPWKANWPPKNAPVTGETHGFKKGEIVQLEGSAGGHPPPVKTETKTSS